MSSKFLFGIVLPAILVMGLALVLRPRFATTAPRAVPAVTAPAPVSKPAANDLPAPLPLPVVTAPAPPPMTEEERQDAIDKEKDRLSDLETSQDPQALSQILADLYSPEKEIRMAAMDAAEQVHNTNAIPVLKAIAVTNQDTDEQMALFQAANFIATPLGSLPGGSPPTPQQIQAAQQRHAQEAASRQAQSQTQPGQNPNSPAGQGLLQSPQQ